jgi:type II secretion system (T2SS) protein F
VIVVLAIAWAALVALPFAHRARRIAVSARALEFRRTPTGVGVPRRSRRGPRVVRCTVPWHWRGRALARRVRECGPLASVVRVAGAAARLRRARRRDDDIARELAAVVDLVGVGVAAGCTPYLAVEIGARWAPPLLRRALDDVVRACALGQSFDDALRELGVRMPSARALTDTLRTSARLGAPVAPALGHLAADVRADLRRRAEARARTVPVRLCFPLVGCILPAFALLTVVPVVLDGLHR